MSEWTKKRLIHPYKSPGEIHIANFLSGQLQESTKNTTRLLSEQCPTPRIRPPSLETFFFYICLHLRKVGFVFFGKFSSKPYWYFYTFFARLIVMITERGGKKSRKKQNSRQGVFLYVHKGDTYIYFCYLFMVVSRKYIDEVLCLI